MHTETAPELVIGVLAQPSPIDPHNPGYEHRTDACYLVGYLDAIHGGCGTEKVPVAELHKWLHNRPGLLIRDLKPLWEH